MRDEPPTRDAQLHDYVHCPHDEIHGNVSAFRLGLPPMIHLHIALICAKCGKPFHPLGIPVGEDDFYPVNGATITTDHRALHFSAVPEGTPTRILPDGSLAPIDGAG